MDIDNSNRNDEDRVLFALVCASNQNRSMAAHYLFSQQGLKTKSYGTGTQVKLPGKSLHKPNVYEFGTKYSEMYNDLKQQDEKLYVKKLFINNQLYTKRTIVHVRKK